MSTDGRTDRQTERHIFLEQATCSKCFEHAIHHYAIASCHFVRYILKNWNAEFVYHSISSFFDDTESSDIFGMCKIIRLYGAHNSFAVRNKFFVKKQSAHTTHILCGKNKFGTWTGAYGMSTNS